MNRTKKSRKNLSWQAARQKTIKRLFFASNEQCNYTNYRIATDVFGKEMNVLGQPRGRIQFAHTDSNLNAIHQMAAITAEIIAPLFVDMPDYAGNYIHIFEN
jgi:hypothetical protein